MKAREIFETDNLNEGISKVIKKKIRIPGSNTNFEFGLNKIDGKDGGYATFVIQNGDPKSFDYWTKYSDPEIKKLYDQFSNSKDIKLKKDLDKKIDMNFNALRKELNM